MPPTVSLPGQQIPGWFKNALVSGFVVFICWGAAIAYWRVNKSAPGIGDLVIYLLALPAALVVAFLIGRRLITSFKAAPIVSTKAQPAQASPAPVQLPPLAILAASLRSPHGATVEELAAAIASNKARADLDRELIDEDGFPVMTARSADASDEMLREEIKEWLARNGMADLQFSEEQWRALTLASAVARDLAIRAAGELVSEEGTAPMLQLMPILPADWPVEQRRAAAMWLEHTTVQFGWPADRIMVPSQATAGTGDATPAAVFGRLAQQVAAVKDMPLAALVVACASHIGQETVDKWAATGSLFTSSQPLGLIPGEGAAGLLVTDVRQAESIESAAFVLLDRIEEARRDTSADEVKRADPNLLGELAEAVCKAGATELAGVAMIVGDVGHRPNRMLELMGFASTEMPQLDDTDDVVCLGFASGTCGAVPFMTGLALARHYTLERDAPVLCTSNEDAYRRCVAMVRPAISLS
jgi:hypothetical protein